MNIQGINTMSSVVIIHSMSLVEPNGKKVNKSKEQVCHFSLASLLYYSVHLRLHSAKKSVTSWSAYYLLIGHNFAHRQLMHESCKTVAKNNHVQERLSWNSKRMQALRPRSSLHVKGLKKCDSM